MTNASAPRPQPVLPFDEDQERLGSPPTPADDGFRAYLRALHPRVLVAMGDGMPVVIKQLVQLLFLLCWPFWAVGGLVVGVVYHGILYPVLWVLFWPVRALLGDKKVTVESADGT